MVVVLTDYETLSCMATISDLRVGPLLLIWVPFMTLLVNCSKLGYEIVGVVLCEVIC